MPSAPKNDAQQVVEQGGLPAGAQRKPAPPSGGCATPVRLGRPHQYEALTHAAENFAVLRHIALNLLQRDTQTRLGGAGKRLKAAWDTDYLAHLLEPQMR